MQKKIYVSGMFDDGTAEKVTAAVKNVNGIANADANPEKSQVLVDYDENVSGIEDALTAAIVSAGVEVLN